MNKKAFVDDISICFGILKFSGIWQNGKQDWKYLAYGWFAQFFYILGFIVCQTIYTFKTVTYEDKVESLAILIVNISGLAKHINFLLEIKRIEMLYKTTCTLEAENDRTDRQHHHTPSQVLSYRLFIGYLVTGFISAFLYVILAIVNQKLPIWLPFDTTTGSALFIVGVLHLFINILYILPIIICLKFLPVLFMSRAIDHLKTLTERLENIGKNPNLDPAKNLIECIKFHIEIKKYINEIQDIFGPIIFIMSASTMFILSLYSINMATVILLILFKF